MKRWLGLCLLVFLAACGTQTTQPAPKYSQEDFAAFVTDVSSDITTLMAKQRQGISVLSSIPQGSPAGQISALTKLPDFKNPSAALQQLQSLSFLNLQTRLQSLATGAPLPRGIFEWLDDNWVQTGDSDDLILIFPADLPGGSVRVEVSFDWDAHSPTISVESFGGTLEVPTGMRILVNLEGESIGHIDVKAQWYNSSCGYQTLEPTAISITGEFGTEGSSDALSFSINFSNDDGQLATDGTIYVKAGEDSAQLSWDAHVNGILTRDEHCFISDYVVESGDLEASLDLKLDGQSSSFSIAFAFDNIVTGPNNEFAADIHDGVITINGDVAVTFEGTLDDANGNGVPGENLILNFADNTSTSLEDFLLAYGGF